MRPTTPGLARAWVYWRRDHSGRGRGREGRERRVDRAVV